MTLSTTKDETLTCSATRRYYTVFGVNTPESSLTSGEILKLKVESFGSNTESQDLEAQCRHPAAWARPDPLGFEAGQANFYQYVGNDPTNATDPSGLQAQPVAAKVTLDIMAGDVDDFLVRRQVRAETPAFGFGKPPVYYGGNIPIVAVVKGTGDPTKYQVVRTVQDYVTYTLGGKKEEYANIQKQVPDGPNPPGTPENVVKKNGNEWTETVYDAPGLFFPPQYLPAYKKATYVVKVLDEKKQVIAMQTYTIEMEIDKQGKVKVIRPPTPMPSIKFYYIRGFFGDTGLLGSHSYDYKPLPK